jgi:hemerythrin superfamily protein
MPDPIEMLTRDHREVEALFDQYRKKPGPDVIERICTELTVHTAVEEKAVYPVLASDVEGGPQMRQHGEEEHAEVKQAIRSIERVGYKSPEVDSFMQEIIKGVTEHVAEEERDVLPALQAQLDQGRLAELGDRVQALKAELMSEAEQAGPLIDLTKEELYELAREKGVEHRSEMNKDELISALRAR